jgi:galactokinase
MDELKLKVELEFKQRYGTAPAIVTRAPGRLELLGNHTDYNEGFVISGTLTNSTWFAAGPADDDVCRIFDACHDKYAEFPLAEVEKKIAHDWVNYLKGIMVEMQQRGAVAAAFNAVVGTSLPLAAGMSSSAALEISAAFALAHVWQVEFSDDQFARIGQAAENNFVGARTGLLDQFSAIHGRAGHLLIIDFRTLEIEAIPFLDGVVFVVANTGIKHDLSEAYNERRSSCETAAELLATQYDGVTTLRDVTVAQLDAAKSHLPLRVYRRAKHIVGENARVKQAQQLLAMGNIEAFGALLFDSHDSSRQNFDNSCPELDILVELGRTLPGCLGARLSGGGFGGISIHLVQAEAAATYCERLTTAYSTRIGTQLTTMTCEFGGGAERYV